MQVEIKRQKCRYCSGSNRIPIRVPSTTSIGAIPAWKCSECSNVQFSHLSSTTRVYIKYKYYNMRVVNVAYEDAAEEALTTGGVRQ